MAQAEADFRAQRSAGMVAIGAGMVVALVVWFGIDRGLPPLGGMADLAARMVLTLKCFVLAVLFALVLGVEAVAHERLVSPAFDPLAGHETRRLRVNKQYLQNTLEQTVVFAAAIFGLAVYCPDGAAMRAVVATTAVWILGRWAFWIGYHRSAAMRGLGAPGMAASMIALIYVAARVGADVAGAAGALAVVFLFLAGEGVLVWTTRTRSPAAD
jgi:hypothetical protein